MSVRNMTKGSPTKLILAVALPLMLGNVFQQLYTVVDAQVVGTVEGVSALAALGASDWFYWLWMGAIQGLAQGFAIPMAHAFGAEDYDGLRKSVGNAAVLALITSLTTTFLSLLTLFPVLNLLKVPASIRHISVYYLSVLFLAHPVVMAYNLMSGILRALGDGRSPLYAMVLASVVNIILDLLFVAVFHWGVVGAAAATVIAQIFSCIFCLFRLRAIPFIRLSRSDLRLQKSECVRLMKLGLPISMQNAIIAVGGMIVQTVVNEMGVVFIAGYTATSKLYGVLDIAAISYSYAMTTYVGQNLGARKFDRISQGVRSALITGVLTAGLISGLMFLFGKPIVSSFISGTPEETEAAVRYACEFLYIMSGSLPILYILYIYRSALQGLGDTMAPMLSGIIEFFMRTLSAIFLPGLIGYSGLFWAEALAWAGADFILIPFYYLSFAKTCRNANVKTVPDPK